MNVQLMRVISRILESDGQTKSSRVLPAFRLAVAFLCILLCALSRNAVFVIAVIAVELLRLAFMRPAAIAQVVRTVIPILLVTGLFLLPAVFMGHPRTLGTVEMKVFESVLILAILNQTVVWKEMTDAFRALHAPQLFVFTLDMTVRFLVILGRYSNAILEAVALRSVGKTHWRNSQAGGVIGTTFLKSQRISQETAEAMACRCFDGEYKSYNRRRAGGTDWLYLALVPVLIAFFIYTEGMMIG